jgi:IS5 family transposase
VADSDPIIQLANAIDFEQIAKIAFPDLKETKKGFWQKGRRLYLRTHLAVLILQSLLKKTDRDLEKLIIQTPIYQAFCGYGLIAKWKCPDHTKIEEFRNRLSPETHKKIGDYIIRVACILGFADPTWVDIDSTVQEANIAYPSDASLMQKLSEKAQKVFKFCQEKLIELVPSELTMDIKNIKKKAQEYFFLSKNTDIEKKREVFKSYYEEVKSQVLPVLDFLKRINPQTQLSMPWNIRQALETLQKHAQKYLNDVAYFIENHTISPGKLLSFHAENIACICKGKIGKANQFGRVFQLGRIGGNFMVAYLCQTVRMEDKITLLDCVKSHMETFGLTRLESVGTDKGYYSQKNIKSLSAMGIDAKGIQRPTRIKGQPTGEDILQLRNRRAGIEPLIGHVKEFGLRKSKMKSDKATLSSGYRSTMGFNLHQIIRNFAGDVKKVVA